MNEYRFDDEEILARQLAEDIATRMRAEIEARGRVSLAVSGGQTPVLLFQALSQQALDWSKVLVTLVDERWVGEDKEGSNAALVKQHLLVNEASTAYFLPLKNDEPTPAEGLMLSENRLHEQIDQLDIVVLGMGLDGHTASWFPQSSALAACLDRNASACCCAVSDAPHFPQRMTMTLSLLLRARQLYLMFSGDEKYQVFCQALEEDKQQQVQEMPVRSLLFQQQVPLHVYRSV